MQSHYVRLYICSDVLCHRTSSEGSGKAYAYMPCADQESFARGDPTLAFILVDEGERIQIPLKAGHHRPTSEMAFRWRADDGPTLNAGLAAL